MSEEALEPAPARTPFSVQPPPEDTAPGKRLIAPLWHTLILVAAVAVISIAGAFGRGAHADGHASIMVRYGISAALELLVVVWVALGLFLRRVPFRSLFGNLPRSFSAFARDIGIAAIFWFASLAVLAAASLTWTLVETGIHHYQAQHHAVSGAESKADDLTRSQQKQIELARKLMLLAPSTLLESITWGALCLIVGFSEETVFRGYLQLQGVALFHRLPLSILLSALVFGAAHGYQGFRNMCLIALFGALFSVLALLRRSLFPGMIAHAWHDFVTVMFLAFVRSYHLLDKLPRPH